MKKKMKQFKEGDNLTLEDVKQSFREVKKNKALLNESVDLSRFPIGKDGAILFSSNEEYETAFGGTVSFEEAFKW